MTSAMDLAGPTRGLLFAWWGKGLIRILLLLIIAAVVAAIVAAFGIARDYGYLRASVLTGSAEEQAQLVAEGKLDIAAMVMQEKAELLHTIINQNNLDISAPHQSEIADNGRTFQRP
jgi:hypothetical protein